MERTRRWLVLVAGLAGMLPAAATADPGPWTLDAAAAFNRRVARVRESLVDVRPAGPREIRRRLLARPMAATWQGFRVVGYEGDVAIEPYSGSIDARVRVDLSLDDPAQTEFYFMSYMPVATVETVDGEPVPFEIVTEQGYDFTVVGRPESAADGDAPTSLVFTLSGKPECAIDGPISVNLCGWGTVSYLAGDLFLPTSLSRDFATMHLAVRLPAGQVLATTGITTDVVPVDGDHEIHNVVQDFPTDSRSLVLGPYEEARVPFDGEGRWIRTLTRPDEALRAEVPGILDDMRNILDFYAKRYGAFLFPKMEAGQIDNKAGAAFGWPALLWIPDGMFGAGGRGYDDEERTALFAHELAHQWYPDMVKNNDGWAAWLSEGFAEYLSIAYMASREGDDWAISYYDYYAMLYTYFIRSSADYGLTSMESQYVSNSWVYQVVTYFKGAHVVHTLEQVIGTEAFEAAMKTLYDEVAGKEAYYNTDKLRRALEASSGQNLDWFFSQWVYGKGYPIYTVGVHPDTEAGTVDVRVQRGTSYQFNTFRMPVKFTVVGDGGEAVHEAWVEQDDATFTFPVQGRFVRVKFDADRDFIKRLMPELDGDQDLSGEVDGIDLLYATWAQGGELGYTYNFIPRVDFDFSGTVDATDLEKVLGQFGRVQDDGGVE